MNKETIEKLLWDIFNAAEDEGVVDDAIRVLSNFTCTVMWFKMSPETKQYVDDCNREVRQHLDGGWDKDWKPKKAAP
jgi:hypothetical protein